MAITLHAGRMRSHPAWALLLLAAMLLALGLGWVGYEASDDASYYQGAARWLTDPPYPGDDHWTTRFPVILSLAMALGLFGKGFTALAVTAIAWYVALTALVGAFAARIGGARAGWIAAILVATLPVVAGEGSTVGCDLAEAFFLVAGAWLATDARIADPRPRRAIAAGLCFGLAILCRETAVLALAGLLPLFLLGRPVSRKTLILIGMAAAGVLAAEMVFQWAMTGEPLRRYFIAFHHDSHIDRAANLEGNFLLHPAIDPLLVLLVNNDFALLFWLAIAAVAAGAHRTVDRARRRRLAIPLALALSAFLLVSALTTKLVLNPRYFMLPALLAAILVAIWLASLAPRWRLMILGAAVAANLLMLAAQNGHPRWAAKALVTAAKAHPRDTIITDADTHRRALIPLAFAGLTNVRTGAPVPGGLYLAADERPIPGAQQVASYVTPPTPLGGLIRTFGLSPLLPDFAANRLLTPNPTARLWRVGGAPTGSGEREGIGTAP